MVKSKIQLRNIQNVAASKTALIDCPIGPRYHYVVLEETYGGGTNSLAGAFANVLEIRVKVNGRVQRTMSGAQLRDINILNGTAYDGVGATPNTTPTAIPIYFAEPWRKDAKDQDALAWATNKWSSFQIEVDLGAGTTPTLVASAIVDNFQPATPGGIVKVIRQSFPAVGISFDIASLDRRDWMQQVSLYASSGAATTNVKKVTVRLNSQILHELRYTANKALLQNFGMTPAASGRDAYVYDVVFDHDDLLGSSVNLEGSRDLTLTIETDAGETMSGSMVAILQRLGPPE